MPADGSGSHHAHARPRHHVRHGAVGQKHGHHAAHVAIAVTILVVALAIAFLCVALLAVSLIVTTSISATATAAPSIAAPAPAATIAAAVASSAIAAATTTLPVAATIAAAAPRSPAIAASIASAGAAIATTGTRAVAPIAAPVIVHALTRHLWLRHVDHEFLPVHLGLWPLCRLLHRLECRGPLLVVHKAVVAPPGGVVDLLEHGHPRDLAIRREDVPDFLLVEGLRQVAHVDGLDLLHERLVLLGLSPRHCGLHVLDPEVWSAKPPTCRLGCCMVVELHKPKAAVGGPILLHHQVHAQYTFHVCPQGFNNLILGHMAGQIPHEQLVLHLRADDSHLAARKVCQLGLVELRQGLIGTVLLLVHCKRIPLVLPRVAWVLRQPDGVDLVPTLFTECLKLSVCGFTGDLGDEHLCPMGRHAHGIRTRGSTITLIVLYINASSSAISVLIRLLILLIISLIFGHSALVVKYLILAVHDNQRKSSTVYGTGWSVRLTPRVV
mmetsp:Transcript_25595/g.55751  ORF Transcript_25595/g.55751 Transcript_25595/m.55751 type:complete len:497 (-) Transcript_25595:44-1534(-)